MKKAYPVTRRNLVSNFLGPFIFDQRNLFIK